MAHQGRTAVSGEPIAVDRGVPPDLPSLNTALARQLERVWVLHHGDFIVPIPGARKIPHLEQNVAAAEITLSADEIARLGDLLSPAKVAGARYPEQMTKMANR